MSSPLIFALLCTDTSLFKAAIGALSFGRSSLEPFRGHEQASSRDGTVTARFLGTTSLVFDDGQTVLLSDGFVSRPSLLRILLRRIAPDGRQIDAAFKRLGLASIDAVFAGHSHYDHAMDAPEFAKRTGAVLIGSPSTMNIGKGSRVPENRLRVVHDGETVHFGKFAMTFIESVHSPGDKFPGTVDTPLIPPARSGAWKTGTTWSVLIEHNGRKILVHGSAGFKPGALRDHRADVVYLGIGGLGKLPAESVDEYWDQVVVATKAKRVIVVHWDNFFRTLDKPLQPLPNAAGSFDRAMRGILDRGHRDGVDILIPVLWEPTDPFAHLPS